MQLVIDTNRLGDLELKEYLQASKNNIAVLTDYVAMEGLNTGTLLDFIEKMSDLRSHPDQVLVLKSTQSICRLSGRAAGLKRRLIHEPQTAGFPKYARKLGAAAKGDARLLNELSLMKNDAKEQIERMLADAESITPIFETLALDFNKDARKKINSGEFFTPAMITTLVPAVMEVAADIFRTHPAEPKVPSFNELPNTFIFRNSLCCYLVALRRAANGSTKMKKIRFDRVRNDMIDTQFATYATYFDGLMTGDDGAAWLHRIAREILSVAFD